MRSRKVAGYVNAVRRARRLRQRLDAKLATIAPLRVRTERAEAEVAGRRGDLTGTQYAEALRALAEPQQTTSAPDRGSVAAEGGTVHRAPEAP